MSDEATILLIDNDPDFLEAVQRRLESEGHRCLTACTGAQGLSRFHDERVDLVVSDLNMPGGDGVSVIEQIREGSDVPIIVVTGFRDDYRKSLRNVHNVTTLRKPFQTQALLGLVEAELTLHAEARAAGAHS